MNFSEDIKKDIKNFLSQNITVGKRDTNSGKWVDEYHKLTDEFASWKKPKRGRFGIVYEVLNLWDFEKYVVKEIKLNFRADYTNTRLTRRSHSVQGDSEATMDLLMACQESVLQSSDELKHENIVRVHDAWIEQPEGRESEDERDRVDPEALIEFINDETQLTDRIRRNLRLAKGLQFFIVMDFFNEDLKERYQRDPAPSRQETTNYIRQIASALQFIHNKGYVHRDLKPRNIFVSEDKKLALGDFGLCKRIAEGDGDHGSAGTPPYNTAPDYLLTSKWDIWSLGVIIYELFYISESDPPPNEHKLDMEITKLVEYGRTNRQQDLSKHVGLKVRQKSLKKLAIQCLQPVESRCTADSVVAKLQPSDSIPTVVEFMDDDGDSACT